MKSILQITIVIGLGLCLSACGSKHTSFEPVQNAKPDSQAKIKQVQQAKAESQIADLKNRVFVLKSATNVAPIAVDDTSREATAGLIKEIQECGLDLMGPMCLDQPARSNPANTLTISPDQSEARLIFRGFDVRRQIGIQPISFAFIFKIENQNNKLIIQDVEVKYFGPVKPGYFSKGDATETTGRSMAYLTVSELTDKDALSLLTDSRYSDMRLVYPAVKHLMISPDAASSPDSVAQALFHDASVFRTSHLQGRWKGLTDKEEVDYQIAFLNLCYAGYRSGRLTKADMNRFAENLTAQLPETKEFAKKLVAETK